jgi:hypothetical protein
VGSWLRRVSDRLSSRKSARRHDSPEPDPCDEHVVDDVDADPVEEWLDRHRCRRLGRMRID